MVNEASAKTRERRDRDRSGAPKDGVLHQGVLGGAKLNPFGDLHTLQHLSARFARGFSAFQGSVLSRRTRRRVRFRARSQVQVSRLKVDQ